MASQLEENLFVCVCVSGLSVLGIFFLLTFPLSRFVLSLQFLTPSPFSISDKILHTGEPLKSLNLSDQGILDWRGFTLLDNYRPLQAHGALGLSSDRPLAQFFSWARILRFADGPDEVHLAAIGKMELKRNK